MDMEGLFSDRLVTYCRSVSYLCTHFIFTMVTITFPGEKGWQVECLGHVIATSGQTKHAWRGKLSGEHIRLVSV